MSRIALIDDSRIDRRYTSACLQEHGHNVDEILPYQVSQVVAVLNHRIPDLILLDFSIPGCAGIEVARACQADPRLRQVPVVIITAHQDAATNLQIAEIDPAGVLHKPCKQSTLVAMVHSILRTQLEQVPTGRSEPMDSAGDWVPWRPLTA